MMNRFTSQAEDALQRAQRIQHAKHHAQLDVGHILLAMLQQKNSLPAEIVALLGSEVQLVIARLESTLDAARTGTRKSSVRTGYLSTRATRALQAAADEADRMGDQYISTEHLLLAIAGEQGDMSALLAAHGITRERIQQVLNIIGPGPAEWNAAVGRRRTGSTASPEGSVEKTLVNPASLPKPSGFNHGVLSAGGTMLFLSGQTALDIDGRIVAAGDIAGQYRQVLSNLSVVVGEAGGSMQDIVKVNIFVRDMAGYKAHLKELGQVHRQFFGTYYPATALIEVSRLFDEDALIEVEGIAVIPST